jgi:hypothetical protein
MDGRVITLKPMSMTKRLQIPVSEQEIFQFQAAAHRAGLPLAQWARRQLREFGFRVPPYPGLTPQAG